MSALIARRLALRRSTNFASSMRTTAARRFESTATSKAAEGAKEAASKAAETAKQAASKTAETSKQAASKTAEATKETTSKAAEAAKDTGSKAAENAKETAAKAAGAARETASKAADAAKETAARAAEGLSRVTSAAAPALMGAAKGATEALGKVGGRTGRFIKFIEGTYHVPLSLFPSPTRETSFETDLCAPVCAIASTAQVPRVVYYSRVGLELGKIVFRNQQMTPPSAATFQTYFQNAWKSLQSPGALMNTISARVPPSNPMQAVRGLSNAQLAAGGVLVAELLGFFTVGEIIGRFKLIGYHGDAHAAHH
ncbi:hypothetical protein RB594_007512 [Gaeumannomyces avenae]